MPPALAPGARSGGIRPTQPRDTEQAQRTYTATSSVHTGATSDVRAQFWLSWRSRRQDGGYLTAESGGNLVRFPLPGPPHRRRCSAVPTNLPVDELRERLDDFVRYRQDHLRGDKKGEAAIFLENLFRALGHEGVRQAGATLEQRIKSATTAAPRMPRPSALDRTTRKPSRRYESEAGFEFADERERVFPQRVVGGLRVVESASGGADAPPDVVGALNRVLDFTSRSARTLRSRVRSLAKARQRVIARGGSLASPCPRRS